MAETNEKPVEDLKIVGETPETPQEAPVQEAPKAQEPPKVDTTQKVETNAYVPTYKVRPEFKQALLKAIGDRPFNEIAGLINAIDVPVLDHQTLTGIVNAIGQFPYIKVENILKNVGNYVTQVIPED